MLAPICLFVFERPIHTKKVLDFLATNEESIFSDLYIYCDGIPENASESRIENILKTREIVSSEKRFKSVTIEIQNKNHGLANSVIRGVSEICNKYDKIIVLEDDLLVAPFFLKYMNESLNFYEKNKKIGVICGYMYPIELHIDNADTFLLSYNSCWGWATWSNVWKSVNFDGGNLLSTIESNKTEREFDFNNSCQHTKMLKQQIKGINNSWAIRWAAFLHINNLFSVFPKKSLVINIGFDGTGVHSGNQIGYENELFNEPLIIVNNVDNEDLLIRKKLELFFKKNKYKNKLMRIKRVIKYSPKELYDKIKQNLK
jgi:hypothetical protein